MDITIIIPTYKPKSYIIECFRSIAAQTFNAQQFEIIIVLNGCKEPYEDELRRYIAEYLGRHIVRLIQVNTSGVSNARNIALDASVGQYITFIDDDDYISPSYLQEMLDIAKTGSMPLTNLIAFEDVSLKVVANHYLSNIFKKYHTQKRNQIFFVRSYFSCPVAKLIKRDIIDNWHFDPRFNNGEDGLFMLLISDKINNISFTSADAVYYRRIRVDSASIKAKKRRDIVFNNLSLIIQYISIWLSNPFKYNFFFVLSRIFAGFRSMIG